MRRKKKAGVCLLPVLRDIMLVGVRGIVEQVYDAEGFFWV